MKSDTIKGKKGKNKRLTLKGILQLTAIISEKKGVFLVGMVFLLLSSSATLIFPVFVGDLIKSSSFTIDEINQIGIRLLVLFIAMAIFSFFRIYLFSIVTENSLVTLRSKVYSHLIKMPMQFFARERVGELNSRISADISMLHETFNTTIAEFIRQTIMIIGGVGVIIWISWKLSLFMLSIVPVIALVSVFFGRYIKKLSKQSQAELAKSNTIVEESFQGILNVKIFLKEKFELMRYKSSLNEVKTLAIKNAKYRGLFASFIIFGLFASIVGVIWYGSILIHRDPNFDVGDLSTILILTGIMGASFGGLATQYTQLLKAVGASEQLLDYLKMDLEKGQDEHQQDSASELKGSIEFSNVSFSYPSRANFSVLNNINLKIKAGSQVALVGKSGSGKSTIANLLLGLYSNFQGSILFDGSSIEKWGLKTIRSNVGLVPQDIFLFGGTIYENIGYGKDQPTKEEIEDAAKKAYAHDFIMSFPDGYQTIVGERGVQLSGGQRQRIAIARTLVKNPSILILDEATSSLDSDSERQVQMALNELLQNRTALIIAHRLSTIKNADLIIVMQEGEIIETGTHSELVAMDGVYTNLTKHQDLMLL